MLEFFLSQSPKLEGFICNLQHEERQISNENGNNKEEMNESTMNTNQEVIEKIFDMMEKFTQRILLIEKKIWNGQL